MIYAMVADFMVRARGMLMFGAKEHILKHVGQDLAKASRQPGFVPETEMRALHGSESSFTILQSDPDGLTLMLARFSPDAETPIHNHNSWGVACVVQGKDRYRHWQLDDGGRLKVQYEKVLKPGDFVVWLDPPHDIHSQQGVEGPALELVLFGKDVTVIPRNYYDPETGQVRTALPQ
jgi:predicted metal-dependent enzyme (double-stranded beta helix superfamily)